MDTLKQFFAIINALLLALLLNLSLSTAKAESLDQSVKLWTQAKWRGSFEYDQAFLYHLELNVRLFNENNVYDQIIARGGLGYQLTPVVSVWQGYDFVPSLDSASDTIEIEQRLWQQMSWQIRQSSPMMVSSRSRLEERHLENNSAWALRLRQRLMLQFPKQFFGKYNPIIADELFFNLNNPVWVNSNAIDQNRVLLGVAMPVLKSSQLVVGYLNQYKVRSSNNKMNHIIYFSLVGG